MSKSLLLLVSQVVLSVSMVTLVPGCSSGDGEITVDPPKTPLTDSANDPAVTVTVKEAPTDGYALDKLTVKAIPDGKDAIDLACTANDVNNDQKLDTGDTLACTEGATNVLGADLAGQEIEIELHATVDGEDTLVGKATWTAAK